MLLKARDYAALLYVAGVTTDDVHKGGYNLSRVGDRGDYQRGNCRFLTCQDNMAEKITSESNRRLSKRTGRKTMKKLWKDPEFVAERRLASRRQIRSQIRKNPGIQKERAQVFAKKYTGSYWANDGKRNFRLLQGVKLPKGYSLGRKPFQVVTSGKLVWKS